MSTLWRKHNYTNKKINIIRDIMIREYDMKMAGLNILYTKGYVDDEAFNKLKNMKNKIARDTIIGKWLRNNNEVNKVMMDEFIEIRKQLFELNDLSDDDIISIKKDAVFIVDKNIKHLKISDNYEFRIKNEFTDFMYLSDIEFYYNKYTDKLDVKGLSKEAKEYQENYYFKLIKDLFKCGKDKDKIFTLLIEFKYNFQNFKLDKGYYKLIQQPVYPFKLAGNLVYRDEIPNELFNKISLNSNLNFINELISIFM